MKPALFESRALDSFSTNGCMGSWQVTRHLYGADKFWHEYLVYRIRNESDAEVGRLVDTRRVAEAFCVKSGTDLEACIEAMAWLVLDRGAGAPGERAAWKRHSARPEHLLDDFSWYKGTLDLGINLLSAAAYFNELPLATRLLSEGYCPATHDHLLPSPMETAAFAGNAEMLMLLQEHLPDFQDTGHERFRYRSKVDPGAVYGATVRGEFGYGQAGAAPTISLEPGQHRHTGPEVRMRRPRVIPRSMHLHRPLRSRRLGHISVFRLGPCHVACFG